MTDQIPEIPGSSHFAPKVLPWIEESFARHGGGEFLFMLTCSEQTGRPLVTVWLRGASVGQLMTAGFSMDNPFIIDAPAIDSTVRALCEGMRTRRTQELAQLKNGSQPGPGS